MHDHDDGLGPTPLDDHPTLFGLGPARPAAFNEGDNALGDPQLIDIPGIEIFASGTHRGKFYSPSEVEEIAGNFAHFAESGAGPRPVLVIGHNENQDLAEDSGLPSVGRVSSLRAMEDDCRHCGNEVDPACNACHGSGRQTFLLADFSEVPAVVGKLIKQRAYRTVSAELYDNYDDQGRNRGTVLRRVALLGGELPQVKSLAELPALANFTEQFSETPQRSAERSQFEFLLETAKSEKRHSPYYIAALEELAGTKRSAVRFTETLEQLAANRGRKNTPAPISSPEVNTVRFSEEQIASRKRVLAERLRRFKESRRAIFRFSEAEPQGLAAFKARNPNLCRNMKESSIREAYEKCRKDGSTPAPVRKFSDDPSGELALFAERNASTIRALNMSERQIRQAFIDSKKAK